MDICCLCGKPGLEQEEKNNPWPLVALEVITLCGLVCCNACNNKRVIPTRQRKLTRANNKLLTYKGVLRL